MNRENDQDMKLSGLNYRRQWRKTNEGKRWRQRIKLQDAFTDSNPATCRVCQQKTNYDLDSVWVARKVCSCISGREWRFLGLPGTLDTQLVVVLDSAWRAIHCRPLHLPCTVYPVTFEVGGYLDEYTTAFWACEIWTTARHIVVCDSNGMSTPALHEKSRHVLCPQLSFWNVSPISWWNGQIMSTWKCTLHCTNSINGKFSKLFIIFWKQMYSKTTSVEQEIQNCHSLWRSMSVSSVHIQFVGVVTKNIIGRFDLIERSDMSPTIYRQNSDKA